MSGGSSRQSRAAASAARAVVPAEHRRVHQQREQLVQGLAVLPAVGERAPRRRRRAPGAGGGAEQRQHRQVGLAVAAVRGRVDQGAVLGAPHACCPTTGRRAPAPAVPRVRRARRSGRPALDRADVGRADVPAVAASLRYGRTRRVGVELRPGVGRSCWVAAAMPMKPSLSAPNSRRPWRAVADSIGRALRPSPAVGRPARPSASTRQSWSTAEHLGYVDHPGSASQRRPAGLGLEEARQGLRPGLHQRERPVAEPQPGGGADVAPGDGRRGDDRRPSSCSARSAIPAFAPSLQTAASAPAALGGLSPSKPGPEAGSEAGSSGGRRGESRGAAGRTATGHASLARDRGRRAGDATPGDGQGARPRRATRPPTRAWASYTRAVVPGSVPSSRRTPSGRGRSVRGCSPRPRLRARLGVVDGEGAAVGVGQPHLPRRGGVAACADRASRSQPGMALRSTSLSCSAVQTSTAGAGTWRTSVNLIVHTSLVLHAERGGPRRGNTSVRSGPPGASGQTARMRSRTNGIVGTCGRAPDPGALARFYSELFGRPSATRSRARRSWPRPRETASRRSRRRPTSPSPVWPPVHGQHRPTMHLDFQVGDLDSAVEDAVALRGTLGDRTSRRRRPGAARPGRPPVLPLPRRGVTVQASVWE